MYGRGRVDESTLCLQVLFGPTQDKTRVESFRDTHRHVRVDEAYTGTKRGAGPIHMLAHLAEKFGS